MKKRTKAILAIGAIIATPIIINKLIAKKAEKRIKEAAITKENVFDWEYGDIHYTVSGKEEAPPLLLIHGLYPGASSLEWKKTAALLESKYRVYSLDLLGFGHSAKPAIDYCSYLYVRLIKDFAENIIGQKTTAAASLHSAASLVICAALNPEDFEKILLISPTGLEKHTKLAQDEESMLKKVLESPILGTSFYNALCSKKALPEFFEKIGLVNHFNREDLEKIYLAAHAGGADGKHALAALVSKFFNTDIKENLSRLEIPYHIITGGAYTPVVGELQLYSGICDEYETITIEGVQLLPHMEDAEKFVTACNQFI